MRREFRGMDALIHFRDWTTKYSREIRLGERELTSIIVDYEEDDDEAETVHKMQTLAFLSRKREM